MGDFILIGTMIGFGLGALHFVYILRARLNRRGLRSGKTLWHALFLWVLWTAFGAYVLILWLIGAALYLTSRVFRRETGLK